MSVIVLFVHLFSLCLEVKAIPLSLVQLVNTFTFSFTFTNLITLQVERDELAEKRVIELRLQRTVKQVKLC